LRHEIQLAVLLSLAAATSVQASERPAEGYIMTVYEDMAEGHAILEGSPGAAIDALTARDSGREFSFAESVNLCVAYTQMKQIEDATRACDAAMMASEREARRVKRMTSHRYAHVREARDVIILALNNRGVLHAVTGEPARARELFEEALDLQSRRPSSQMRASTANNLARLGKDLATDR
jgi:hypothetical protein